MVDFTFHTPESAPRASRTMLENAKKQMGFYPNLFAGLAESPQILEAYLTLDKLFSNTSLSPEQQQTVLLAISTENGCGYCQAAHGTLAANNTSLEQEQIEAVQAGESLGDNRLDALVKFSRAVVKQRGEMQDKQIQEFIEAGFSQQAVLEVILAVSMKTLSNYSNHVLKTPVDEAFREQEPA